MIHLFDPTTGTHYNNGGEIPKDTPVPVQGWQWVEGPAPEGAQDYIVSTTHDKLKAILVTLAPEVQAQFGMVAAAVDLAVENGEPGVAILEIQALTLPTELEPVRTQMLAVLNAV